MPENAVQISGNIGGILAICMGFAAKIYELLTFENVNNWLQLVVGIIGALFLLAKWRGVRLDNRKKQKELEDD